jgi:hypothetical protein
MRAAAADFHAATFCGAGKADIIPQGMQKQPIRFQLQTMFFTVHLQSNRFFHEFGTYLLHSRDSTYLAFSQFTTGR